MRILGITGTIGAGKGTIVEYLVNEKGYRHYSVRDYIKKEIISRGLPINRDSMVLVANDLRSRNSPSFITDQLYYEAKNSGENAIIESIRTPGEVFALKKKANFYLIAVDADPGIRYKRIKKRGSETDKISFETFLKNEKREMNSDDPNHQNLQRCIDMADVCFENNGTKEDLYTELDKYLNKLK